MNNKKKTLRLLIGLLEQYTVLMFAWDVYGDRSGQTVTVWWEENG